MRSWKLTWRASLCGFVYERRGVELQSDRERDGGSTESNRLYSSISPSSVLASLSRKRTSSARSIDWFSSAAAECRGSGRCGGGRCEPGGEEGGCIPGGFEGGDVIVDADGGVIPGGGEEEGGPGGEEEGKGPDGEEEGRGPGGEEEGRGPGGEEG
jgi:hypothetical protein